MKRKHFIIALMAMLFSFSFTTSAQQLLVNCDYNSSTEGWGTTKFSNYAGAYAYATANSKTSATIVIEKTNTLSGNTFDNNHKNYYRLAVVIKDGAAMGNAASKWDMTYPVTVEPGGTLTCARPKNSSVSYIHIKNKLIVGAKGATKKAYVNFLSDSYADCDISIRYNGSIEVYNADFAVQDLDAQGKLTIEDSKVEVDGAFASATSFLYPTTLTNSTITINGNQISGGLIDFSGGTSNQLGNVKINNSTLTIKEGDTKVAANVTATNSTIDVNNLTVNSGKTLNLNEGSTLDAENITTAGTGSVKIDGNTAKIENGQIVNPVAQIGTTKYYSLAEAAAAATAGNEIVMLADETLAESLTLPAGITFNGNGKQINGTLVAAGDITFAGVTKVGDLDFGAYSTEVTIPAGASLQLNGSARMSIGFGTTFNITGTIENAKIADKATLTPSLVIPGALFSGTAGVTFNVTNAYISVPSSYCSTSKTASGTFDFNITNSIWESAGKLAFEEQSVNAKVDFALVNSVLTTGSHLVFGTASGEEGVVIDNSLVNEGTSRQLENCGKMTIKNGSVVNGAVATSSNAKNPGTVIVENATYAVTGEFSGSDLGTGTLIIKKGANVSAGSITKANITVDAEGMTAGDVVNLTANLANLAGELSVINNDKLEAKIVEGKVVLAAKPVAKIGEQGYATLNEAFAAATEGQTITMLDDATPALTSQRAITKAAVIDLGGKTMTLTEDDLYFGTTTFKNGTIVVDPSVKPSTAVFWMFANQTLTFDNVKIVATGVTGTYLIGLDGNNSDLNLLNGSEILVENTTALDLDIICVNASTGNDIKVENSKVNVTNIDGRVFFRGNYTVKDSEVNLAGITKAGFRIEAGQTLSIEGTSKVNIEGEPRDGGIHMTDLSATYKKAETATVNATVNEPKVAKVGENTYRTLAQAVAAVEDGGTITLIANETFTKNNRYNNGGYWDGLGYSGDKSFTIDLGGFTIGQNGALNDYLIWIKNDGAKGNTITLKNGTLDAGTTAYCALATASSNAQKITVNLENIKVINNKSNGSTLKIRGGAELNVKAGTEITGKDSYLGIECVASTVNIYDGAKIYMNGTSSYNGCLVGACAAGTVNVYGGYGKGVKGGFIAMTSGGTINVEGGEWIANTDGTVGNNSNLYVLTAQSNKYESGFAGASIINVTGGTFRGGMDAWVLNNLEGEKAELNISGGNFNSNPSAYVKAGYVATEAAGIYTVVEAPAYIEGKASYVSLAAAYEAAVNGDVIVLNESVTTFPVINKAVTFKGGKENAAVEINYALSQNFTAIDGTVKFENLTFNKPLFTEQGGTKPGLTIEFEGCNFNVPSDQGYAILIGTSWSNSVVKGLKVNNCNFKYVGDVFKGGYMLYVQCVNEVSITNNTIDGNNLYRGAIHLGDATEHATVATVSNNTIKNFCRGVMMGNRVADSFATISGNTFDNINYSDKDSKPAQECAPIFIHSNATSQALKIALTDNKVENCTNPMIYSEDTDLIKYYVTEFTGNTVGGTAVELANSYNAPNQIFPVATINDAEYFTLQAAVNAVKNGETITLTGDVTESVTLTEKVGLYYTIDGNGKTMNGKITITPLSDENDNRRITIKNINFVNTADAAVDFISCAVTNHYPRLTVDGCTFTGNGNDTDVALRLKTAYGAVIKNCTGTGLHSFLQNTAGKNFTIENVTVTESKSGFALGTVQGVTVKGCEADVEGYGIRLDAQYNNNAVIESNKIKAFIPVVVRKAEVESNITVQGTNEMTASNADGLWMAVGTSEYEENGQMPTAATGNVVVALNDAALDSKGIYGNALAGQGTAEAPYLINNIGELVLFRNSVNAGETKYSAPGVHVALGADIDMTGINWVGIGSMTAEHGFMGNFDGKGFKIMNLTIDTPALDSDGYAYAGLFALTEGIDKANQNFVKNLVIENVTINTTGKIAAAAIAYAYYTIVDNVKVCGNIAITGGDYTAGVLAYTRRCVNASNLSIIGESNSFVKGAQVVGGVISDIQMNGGLVAEYSNFSAEGVTVTGTKNVGGISGIIATQTLNGAVVKNVTLNSDNAQVGIVAGCLGGTSTISNVTYENVAGATTLLGATYEGGAIEAKIGDTYYATLDAALAAEGEATVELFVPVTVATGESRVIELNGKTVIGTDNATGSFALININPEAELTINGEGAIKLTATNNRGWNAYSSVISNQRGKLTVNGGTIEHLGGTDMAYAIDNLTNTGAQNAETVINGGTVKSTYRAIRQFLNSTSAQNVLTVNGGTIEGANKSIWMQGANANANPGALTVAAAAAIKGDVYLTTAAGTAEYPVIVAVAADALKDGAQVLTSNVPADFAVANVNGTWTKVDAAASLNGKGYATLRAAVEAAQNGETVELLANVTLAGGYEDAAEGLRIEREITLNGNGHTIDCGNFQKGIRVYNPSNVSDFNVNFNNVKVVNNVVNGRCIDTRSGNINLKVNSSTLIATNGNSQPLTIGGNDPVHRVTLNETTIDAGASGYAVISFVSTNVDIQGVNNSSISGFAAFYLKGDAKTTNLNLGQGVYTGTNNHAVESGVFGTVVLEGDNNVVNLMGTNATVKAIANNTAHQAAFLVRGANNTIKITKESAKIITEGNAYEAMVNADNAATTKLVDMGIERKLVAENRGYQFYSFEEAVRFAGNEGTIKIVNDFELAEAWTVAAGQNITLDLNGKTVSYTSAVAGEDMITNRGNLTITDSSDAKTGKLTYVNTDATGSNVTVSTISSEPGSVLNITGGTVENKTVKTDGSSIYSFAIDMLTNGNLGDVTATIAGGTVYSDYMAIRQFNNGTACKNTLNITGGHIYGAKRAVQVHLDNNAAYTTISGGKVEAGADGYAICNFAATGNLEVTGGEFIGAVYSALENFISGGTYNNPVEAAYCAAGYMPNKNTDGTYGVVLAQDVVASIDGVTYGSLKAAVAAAKAGETITLLQDVKENVTISKHLTIDGAGKTITGMITTDGKSLKVTIKNVNFNGNNKSIYYAVKADDDLNLVVENCSVDSYSYGFLYANKSNDKIVVKNVTVENCASYGAYLVSFNSATFENFTVIGAQYGVAVSNAGARKVSFKNVSFDVTGTPLHINEQGTGNITFNFSGINDMGKAEYYRSQYVNVVAAAQVGTKVCGSLQDAIAAAQTGETVKMLSDINLGWNDVVKTSEGYTVLSVVEGKNITLDMNGKKITVDHQSTTDRIFSVIFVEDGAGLTVTGEGSIEIDADDNAPKVAYMFWKRGSTGYLVIENGDFYADNTEDSMVYSNGSGIVTVNGGTFTLEANGTRVNGFPWIFNVAGNDVGYVNVNGGTYNYDVSKQFWAKEVKIGSGFTVRYDGDDDRTWSVVTGITLVDGEFTGYTNNETKEVEYISYTRNNIPTTWTPIYLPFEVPVEVLAEQGFDVAYINGVRRDDTNYDGELDDFVMEIIYIHCQRTIGGNTINIDGRAKTLKANYPYFVRSTDKPKKLNIELDNVKLYAAQNMSYECTTMTESFTITGNSSSVVVKYSDENRAYAVASGEWKYSTSGAKLNPFRFYMTVTSRDGSEPVGSAASSVRIVVRGHENEDGTTTIYDVVGTKQNSDVIYDIHGRRVLNPVKGSVYIVNGKKVIF